MGTTCLAMFNTRDIALFICITIQLCVITAGKLYQNITVQNILRKNIFSNYDRVVIPTIQDSFLKVNMRIIINSVDLDYEKSQMILSTWFIATWRDDRLSWNPDEYDQLESIIVDHREIWHPDVMAFNNVDANMEDDRTRVNSVLNSNGSVIWVEPVQYSVHCQTDTTHWPYDTQAGVLRLGSWMYNGNVLNLTTYNDEVELSSSHSEWEITNVHKERHVRFYPCCPGEQYIDIEYNITIKRKVHPYQSIIYIPALFVYYTYSLGLISMTMVISMAVKEMSAVSKPLPHGVMQFLHSDYLEYLGIKINDSATDGHMLCESEEMNAQTVDLNERQKCAKVIDRICFVLFAVVYLILLLRFMP
ncbi:acetylcholine receptor subunit alpha-like 1 isoform X3 [Sipha flava]|uniref:Acetylcholine receptor subunit alpha-like 1 isoform X3 n=1 Tax=Sipha flava TaxID=143950 RepID=A0A8B8FNX0_9HEMI|nr:acetylcholine receptor subunit alpha-like 1 isoform X3 [Sipha flava]